MLGGWNYFVIRIVDFFGEFLGEKAVFLKKS